MALHITMIKAPGSVTVSGKPFVFDGPGGTIGRGDNNHLVLEDPDRFLSGSHCQIKCDEGRIYIVDLSTNGTFINGSPEPIGKGGQTELKSGDTFEIGDYVFRVGMSGSSGGEVSPFEPMGEPFGTTSDSLDDFLAPEYSPVAPMADPFGAADVHSETTHYPQDSVLSSDVESADPLAILDRMQAGSASPATVADPFAANTSARDSSLDFYGASYSDEAGAMNQAVAWPEASCQNLIPEEWEEELGVGATLPDAGPDAGFKNTSGFSGAGPADYFSKPAPVEFPAHQLLDETHNEPCSHAQQGPAPEQPRPRFGEQQVTPPQRRTITPEVGVQASASHRPAEEAVTKAASETPSSSPRQHPQPKATPAAAGPHAATLVEAMGLDSAKLSEEQLADISRDVGLLMREVVGGMMQVLRSRSSIKNEFRMNVTTIQPVENNPLKFSADVDEALDNMFVRRSNAYKNSVDAVREGFQEVGEHQVAMIAGIRHGFEQMMKRFDPEILENNFDRQGGGGMLPGMKKSKYWTSYNDHYKSFVDNMEHSFQHLFGSDFVHAYEDQLHKLKASRKKNN